MKTSRCFCFSDRGLFNRRDITLLEESPEIDTVVLVGDGSDAAFEHMMAFHDNPILKRAGIQRIGVARVPKLKMQSVAQDGKLSTPNYLYDDADENKWLCSVVAAPLIRIFLSDITSQSGTQALLEPPLTETLCFMSHQLWNLILTVEDRLCFPAVVIDRLTRWTYHLTPNTIDIPVLRRETGFTTLDYNPNSDVLSVEVAQEVFTVKLSVLNEIYGSLILPFFAQLYGRRLRMMVSVFSGGMTWTEPTDMSYGQLGSLIEGMRMYIRKTILDKENPHNIRELLAWARRVRINDESCIWTESSDTLIATLQDNRDQFVLPSRRDDSDDSEASQEAPEAA